MSSFEDQQREIRESAVAALKRIGGVDGVIGIKSRAMKANVPLFPKPGTPEELLRELPDLLAIATWAHYQLSSPTQGEKQ